MRLSKEERSWILYDCGNSAYSFMGMDKAIGNQISFIITALWWGLLTVPMIRDVQQRYYVEPEPRPILNSFNQLQSE